MKGYINECGGEVATTAIGWVILWLDSFVMHWTMDKAKRQQYVDVDSSNMHQTGVIPTHPDYTHCLAMVPSTLDKKLRQLDMDRKGTAVKRRKLSTPLWIC